MDLQTKVAILRQHEIYCYQICYYFIQDEQLSVQAACKALLKLAHDPVFFNLSLEKQTKKLKIAAVHSTLSIKSIA